MAKQNLKMVDDMKQAPMDAGRARLLDAPDPVYDADFWRAFAPDFTISDAIDPYAFPLSDEAKAHNKKRVHVEGYTHLKNPGFKLPIDKMPDLFLKIREEGLPPAFAFVFDEMWALASQMRNLVDGVLGENYAILPDFWVWIIDAGAAGFVPHRDKGPNSLFPDKTPKSITTWLPITEAHPLNGCMYIVPANRDACYGVSQAFNGQLADVRALPGQPGDVFTWTQHAYHWGAHAADEHDLPPRMSVAFEFQRLDVPAFNTPLLPKDFVPPFETRLALIAKQVLQYTHLWDASPEIIEFAQDVLIKTVPANEGDAS